MKNRPLLSIIVPVYNVERYLERCLHSLINQTYTNIEIILVDDGSPDNCPILCEQWALKNDKIKVIHKNNEGLGYARNSGLKVAKGEYIAFVDSDDYVDIHMYEMLIEKAIEAHADIVYCGYHNERNGKILSDVIDFEKETIYEANQMLDLSLKYIPQLKEKILIMSVWHSIYKREIIKVDFFSEREVVSEDLHFQLTAILNSQKIVYLPYALYYYCQNDSSLSHTFLFEKFYRFKNLSYHLKSLYQKYGIYDIAYLFFFALTVGMTRQIISNNNLSLKEKRMYLFRIISDPFWEECTGHLKLKNIPKHLKLLYYILRLRKKYLLYPYALFDYYIVCRKFGLK